MHKHHVHISCGRITTTNITLYLRSYWSESQAEGETSWKMKCSVFAQHGTIGSYEGSGISYLGWMEQNLSRNQCLDVCSNALGIKILGLVLHHKNCIYLAAAKNRISMKLEGNYLNFFFQSYSFVLWVGAILTGSSVRLPDNRGRKEPSCSRPQILSGINLLNLLNISKTNMYEESLFYISGVPCIPCDLSKVPGSL